MQFFKIVSIVVETFIITNRYMFLSVTVILVFTTNVLSEEDFIPFLRNSSFAKCCTPTTLLEINILTSGNLFTLLGMNKLKLRFATNL